MARDTCKINLLRQYVQHSTYTIFYDMQGYDSLQFLHVSGGTTLRVTNETHT